MVRVVAGLWFAVAATGVLGVVAALLDGDALRADLAATARASDPSATTAVIDDAVTATLATVLGAVVLLAVLTTVWTALLLGRRSWPRWLLLFTGLLSLVGADLGQSMTAVGAGLDRGLFIVQAVLILPALVLLFIRPTRAWVRPEPASAVPV